MANQINPPRTVTSVSFTTMDLNSSGRIVWDTGLAGTVPSDADMIATAQALRDQSTVANVTLSREVTNGELVDLDAGAPTFTL